MEEGTPGPVSLLTFSDEWARSRNVIEKADERIHETRKLVFGLFSTLLAASSIVGKDRSSEPALWIGVHLALLGLLIAGRFVEQQTFLLQAAAASRAWVLELLTPIELTGTLCDRFVSMASDEDPPQGRRMRWPARTTYVYAGLGLVSAAVTGLVVVPSLPRGDLETYALWFTVVTVAYILGVIGIGRQDLEFARDGRDWSLSATSVRVDEPVHIVLANQEDKDLEVTDPPATIVRFEFNGQETSGADDRFPLRLPASALVKGKLHRRAALHWVWKPTKPGLWGLRITVPNHDPKEIFLRRFVHVEPASATAHTEVLRQVVGQGQAIGR